VLLGLLVRFRAEAHDAAAAMNEMAASAADMIPGMGRIAERQRAVAASHRASAAAIREQRQEQAETKGTTDELTEATVALTGTTNEQAEATGRVVAAERERLNLMERLTRESEELAEATRDVTTADWDRLVRLQAANSAAREHLNLMLQMLDVAARVERGGVTVEGMGAQRVGGDVSGFEIERVTGKITEQQDAVYSLADAFGALGVAFGGASDLMREKMGEQSAAYKSFAIAEAIAATYLAANQALAQPGVPMPFKIAQMAGVIATGLANVERIRNAGSGGGGGHHSGAMSSPARMSAAPQASMVQVTLASDRSETITVTPTEWGVIRRRIVEDQRLVDRNRGRRAS
jgi:hypothetical protein